MFEITQNTRDESLLRALINQLGCGKYYYDIKNNTGTYTVSNFTDISNIIIPLFLKHAVLGIKALDFSDWCAAAKIIETGGHLTAQGADTILDLKLGMNKGREASTTFTKPLIEGTFYIYNKNQTVLYYYTTNLSDLTLGLNIQESALIKHLNKGTVYLKSFTFSNTLIAGVQEQLVSVADLNNKLNKIREGKKSK